MFFCGKQRTFRNRESFVLCKVGSEHKLLTFLPINLLDVGLASSPELLTTVDTRAPMTTISSSLPLWVPREVTILLNLCLIGLNQRLIEAIGRETAN